MSVTVTVCKVMSVTVTVCKVMSVTVCTVTNSTFLSCCLNLSLPAWSLHREMTADQRRWQLVGCTEERLERKKNKTLFGDLSYVPFLVQIQIPLQISSHRTQDQLSEVEWPHEAQLTPTQRGFNILSQNNTFLPSAPLVAMAFTELTVSLRSNTELTDFVTCSSTVHSQF